MAEFLTTNGIVHHLENIINNSRRLLVIISPYLKISRTLLERLKDASSRNVSITIIYGKEELKQDEFYTLKSIKNVELFFSENLHAKCYYNENTMLITSMNLYEFSEKNNREMGILIDSSRDKDVYINAIKETESIINHASVKKSVTTYSSNSNTQPYKQKKQEGYCIRCKTRLNHQDISSPYCKLCYIKWSEYSNPYYTENYCMICGGNNSTSKDKPVCRKCYNSLDFF